ncbi:hypothetical protein SS1G_03911 [Sclerotinia sclerotiorum 1980 UF-70]|uniref:Uncharacterized protein n=1 Tax=Sclerotinia sclerotiorum (strain ATCC 18683 / 1980 / Ss-1) TaxID=665079 RepID=A7EF20_SCLS1|nr:hypothetical protein SS1G_03911 [Sclerotinia sclerotiorum 1980 UF-70]EDO01436.1 hypothetical protein SS1G_03911 [Sclerotinia sclerotiorum 1980 UF-70]
MSSALPLPRLMNDTAHTDSHESQISYSKDDSSANDSIYRHRWQRSDIENGYADANGRGNINTNNNSDNRGSAGSESLVVKDDHGVGEVDQQPDTREKAAAKCRNDPCNNVPIWHSQDRSVVPNYHAFRFSRTQNSFVFPNTALATATIQIGKAFGSNVIRIIGTVISVILVVVWLGVLSMIIRALFLKRLLMPDQLDGAASQRKKWMTKFKKVKERK